MAIIPNNSTTYSEDDERIIQKIMDEELPEGRKWENGKVMTAQERLQSAQQRYANNPTEYTNKYATTPIQGNSGTGAIDAYAQQRQQAEEDRQRKIQEAIQVRAAGKTAIGSEPQPVVKPNAVPNSVEVNTDDAQRKQFLDGQEQQNNSTPPNGNSTTTNGTIPNTQPTNAQSTTTNGINPNYIIKAIEVWDKKHGNGNDRKNKLGKDYFQVQALVNKYSREELMKMLGQQNNDNSTSPNGQTTTQNGGNNYYGGSSIASWQKQQPIEGSGNQPTNQEFKPNGDVPQYQWQQHVQELANTPGGGQVLDEYLKQLEDARKRYNDEYTAQKKAWQDTYNEIIAEREKLYKADMSQGEKKRKIAGLTTLLSAFANLVDAYTLGEGGLVPVRDYSKEVAANYDKAYATDTAERTKESNARVAWLKGLREHQKNYPKYDPKDNLGKYWELMTNMERDKNKFDFERWKVEQGEAGKNSRNAATNSTRRQVAQTNANRPRAAAAGEKVVEIPGNGGDKGHATIYMPASSTKIEVYRSLMTEAAEKGILPKSDVDNKILKALDKQESATAIKDLYGEYLGKYPEFVRFIEGKGFKVTYSGGQQQNARTPYTVRKWLQEMDVSNTEKYKNELDLAVIGHKYNDETGTIELTIRGIDGKSRVIQTDVKPLNAQSAQPAPSAQTTTPKIPAPSRPPYVPPGTPASKSSSTKPKGKELKGYSPNKTQ